MFSFGAIGNHSNTSASGVLQSGWDMWGSSSLVSELTTAQALAPSFVTERIQSPPQPSRPLPTRRLSIEESKNDGSVRRAFSNIDERLDGLSSPIAGGASGDSSVLRASPKTGMMDANKKLARFLLKKEKQTVPEEIQSCFQTIPEEQKELFYRMLQEISSIEKSEIPARACDELLPFYQAVKQCRKEQPEESIWIGLETFLDTLPVPSEFMEKFLRLPSEVKEKVEWALGETKLSFPAWMGAIQAVIDEDPLLRDSLPLLRQQKTQFHLLVESRLMVKEPPLEEASHSPLGLTPARLEVLREEESPSLRAYSVKESLQKLMAKMPDRLQENQIRLLFKAKETFANLESLGRFSELVYKDACQMSCNGWIAEINAFLRYYDIHPEKEALERDFDQRIITYLSNQIQDLMEIAEDRGLDALSSRERSFLLDAFPSLIRWRSLEQEELTEEEKSLLVRVENLIKRWAPLAPFCAFERALQQFENLTLKIAREVPLGSASSVTELVPEGEKQKLYQYEQASSWPIYIDLERRGQTLFCNHLHNKKIYCHESCRVILEPIWKSLGKTFYLYPSNI